MNQSGLFFQDEQSLRANAYPLTALDQIAKWYPYFGTRFFERTTMSRYIIRSLARLAVLLIVGGLPARTIASGCPCNYVPIKVLEVISASTLLVELDGSRETVNISQIQALRPAPDSSSDSTWCESEGQKAFEAKAFARSLIEKAQDVSIDERQVTDSGAVTAVVYVDNLSLGQEILYKYLAVEKGGANIWCPS